MGPGTGTQVRRDASARRRGDTPEWPRDSEWGGNGIESDQSGGETGNSRSAARGLQTQRLRSTLLAGGANVPATQREQFLTFVPQPRPRFPEEGTMNEHTWAQVGQQMRESHTAEAPACIPISAVTVRALIGEASNPVKEGRRVRKTVAGTLATTAEGFTPLKATAPPLEPGDEPEVERESEREAAEDEWRRMRGD